MSEPLQRLAIVDGQQRLTSLYAVVKGAEIIRSDFKKERVRIAFNPLSEKFDVADAAIGKDKTYIPDISELWKPETKLIAFIRTFVAELRATRDLSEEERSVSRRRSASFTICPTTNSWPSRLVHPSMWK